MEDQPPSQPPPADFISAVPDDSLLHIVSFLPTASAARTSLLSCRFHRLLHASPTFLNLDTYSERHMTPAQFLDLADQTLVRCSAALSPPRHLHLRLLCCCHGDAPRITPDNVLSVLSKAGAVGLRHLSVQLDSYVWMWRTVLPCILSIPSLESLSLQNVVFTRPRLPPVNLKQLRSLSITSGFFEDGFIDRLVPKLDALEELRLTMIDAEVLHLKSNSLRKLQLALGTKNLRVSAPVLERLELVSEIKFEPCRWDFEMPVLRKAVVRLNCVFKENVESVFKMLGAISHVQELDIDIWEGQDQRDIFPALLVPGVDPPTFLNLKHFRLEICFHEYNIENLVTILQNSPALESLELIHKPTCYGYKDKESKLWRSRIPGNAEGNYRHAFEDLHIPGRKEELLGQLMAK